MSAPRRHRHHNLRRFHPFHLEVRFERPEPGSLIAGEVVLLHSVRRFEETIATEASRPVRLESGPADAGVADFISNQSLVRPWTSRITPRSTGGRSRRCSRTGSGSKSTEGSSMSPRRWRRLWGGTRTESRDDGGSISSIRWRRTGSKRKRSSRPEGPDSGTERFGSVTGEQHRPISI
jgi:hypothetical protein